MPRARATLFILITIFVDAIGFGIVMPVVPRLLMDVARVDIAGATAIYGWMALLYAVAQFFCGPVIGNLSDRFGRRPILLGALAGLAADYLLMAVAQTLPLLFLGRAIAGILGGSYGPAQAALADRTGPDGRARLFGFVGAAFGIGFVVGPAIGGLLGMISPRAPFFAAAALAAINFAYGLTVFPRRSRRKIGGGTIGGEPIRSVRSARRAHCRAWSTWRRCCSCGRSRPRCIL